MNKFTFSYVSLRKVQGKNYAMGINPADLKPSKMVLEKSRLTRIKSAFKKGISIDESEPIEITTEGVVLSGHHRVYYLLKNKGYVDAYVVISTIKATYDSFKKIHLT